MSDPHAVVATTPDAGRVTETVVGYRVDAHGPDGDAVAVDAEGRRVRLVRIRQEDAAGEDAVTAWLAADGEHVQRILDVGTAPSGDLVAVLTEPPYALGALVAARALTAGEAVTVLVPVAETLAALHEAGVVHGALGVPGIAMTEAGAPLLLLPRTARRRGLDEEAVREDRRALASLARRLLPPPTPSGVLEALERDPGGDGVDALFALADPEPVRMARSEPRVGGAAMPSRLVAPMSGGAEPTPAPDIRRHRIRTVLATLRRGARSVRPRVWVAAGASLVALLAALVLLPGSPPAARAGAQQAPVTRTPAPAASPEPTRTGSAPSESDDPVRAAEALLAARARCLTAGSARCLDATDEAGSPLDGLDRAALAAGVDAVLPPTTTPVLLRRTGATAVLAVGPCTVLELRGAPGWRLRDVLAPAPAPTQMPSEPVKSPSSSRARTAERNRAASAPSTMRWS